MRRGNGEEARNKRRREKVECESLSSAWRGPLGTAPTERAGGATVGVSGGGGLGTKDSTS